MIKILIKLKDNLILLNKNEMIAFWYAGQYNKKKWNSSCIIGAGWKGKYYDKGREGQQPY